MAKNFSDKYIASLKPKLMPYQVREAKGFALRILPSGVKTFLFIYEKDGKRKQLNLGIYPHVTLQEARAKYNYAADAWYRGEDLVKELMQKITVESSHQGISVSYGVIMKWCRKCEKVRAVEKLPSKEEAVQNYQEASD